MHLDILCFLPSHMKMRKSAFYLYLIGSAVFSIVSSKEWALDSPLEDELNGFGHRFNSLKVSIFVV